MNAPLNNVNVPFNYTQGTHGGYIHEVSACKGKQLHTMELGRHKHEISAMLMVTVVVITLQSQFASLAKKSARKYSALWHKCRWMFTEKKADKTFHVTYTYLYLMASQ